MKKLLVIIIGLLISGCSATKMAKRKIRKAKRLDPELFVPDTIKIHDTIIVESFHYDTITKVVYHDSVTVVDNEKVYLKYFYDTLRQEIHHEVECKEQEVIYEKEIIREKTIDVSKSGINWLHILIAVCVVLVVVVIYSKR